MYLRIFLASFLLLIVQTVPAQTQLLYKYGGQLAGPGSDIVNLISADDSGNVYVAGRAASGFDADPGPGSSTLTAGGFGDSFLAKYDSNGVLKWINKFTASSEILTDLTIDPNGDIYLTGNFFGSILIGAQGPGAMHPPIQGSDGILIKYNSSGQLIYSLVLGGPGADYINSIAFDTNGDFYLGGEFDGQTFDADAGPGIHTLVNTLSNTYDPYVVKYSNSGSFLWARSFKGYSSDYITTLAVDPSNRVITGGYFQGQLQCDTLGSFFLNTTNSDAYLIRLNSNGDLDTAWAFESTGSSSLHEVVCYGNDILCSGKYALNMDMDPSPGSMLMMNKGITDIFLISLNDSGLVNWGGNIGSTGTDVLYSMIINSMGEILLAGTFSNDSADFNWGPGTTMLTGRGNTDGFLAKYTTSGNFNWAYHFGCDSTDYCHDVSFTPSGEIWLTGGYVSGVYLDPQSNLPTFSHLGNGDGYIVRYKDCDYPTISTQPSTSGVCAGDNAVFTINGMQQNISLQWQEGTNGGTTWTNINNGGAYSGATSSSLMISNISPALNNRFYRCVASSDCGLSTTSGVGILFVSTVDTSVNFSNFTLNAALNINSTYQWLDCNTGFAPLTGAVNPSFTPAVAGSYAVQISNSVCTDTSTCFNVTSVGLVNVNRNDFLIYPVPAKSELKVEMKIPGEYEAHIRDFSGRILSNNNQFKTQTELSLAGIEPGVYMLLVSQNGGRPTAVRFVKQ